MTRNLREDEIVPGRTAQQKRAMIDAAKASADATLKSYMEGRGHPIEFTPTEMMKDAVWQAEFDDQLDEAIEEFEAKQIEKVDEC